MSSVSVTNRPDQKKLVMSRAVHTRLGHFDLDLWRKASQWDTKKWFSTGFWKQVNQKNVATHCDDQEKANTRTVEFPDMTFIDKSMCLCFFVKPARTQHSLDLPAEDLWLRRHDLSCKTSWKSIVLRIKVLTRPNRIQQVTMFALHVKVKGFVMLMSACFECKDLKV